MVPPLGGESISVLGGVPSTETVCVVVATEEPLQETVCPVNARAVEQPASSVTVRVAV